MKSPLLAAARLCVIGATVVAAGCASKQASYDPPARVAGPPPGQWKVEIEDDGLPTQLGPRNPRPVQDEPNEPWSPNYGKPAPQKTASAFPPAPMPSAKVAEPLRKPVTRVTDMDEDALIRRAIAEHEMRRRD